MGRYQGLMTCPNRPQMPDDHGAYFYPCNAGANRSPAPVPHIFLILSLLVVYEGGKGGIIKIAPLSK